MAATVHGNISWGLDAETGLYVESVDFDITMQEEWVPDEDGDDVAGVLYNPSATFSMKGVLRIDQTLSAELGAAIVLANAVDWTDYIPGYTTGGLTYVNSVKPSLAVRKTQSIDVGGAFKPFLVPAA